MSLGHLRRRTDTGKDPREDLRDSLTWQQEPEPDLCCAITTEPGMGGSPNPRRHP